MEVFKFKKFSVYQDQCLMKLGTDSVLLGAWTSSIGPEKVLDIGTGTGVIALIIAQNNPEAIVDGIEIDADSAAQAEMNFNQSPFKSRLKVIHDAIQSYSEIHDGIYDLLVCNPPFFTGGTLSEVNGRNAARHTVKLPHAELIHAARKLLHEEGRLNLILPYIEGLRFEELAKSYGFYAKKITEVITRPNKPIERLLMSFSKQEGVIEKDSITIQKDSPLRNDWSEEYKSLTQDFYLNL
jgi:tRNA1Val (adenine37-N6)-methyltransferase